MLNTGKRGKNEWKSQATECTHWLSLTRFHTQSQKKHLARLPAYKHHKSWSQTLQNLYSMQEVKRSWVGKGLLQGDKHLRIIVAGNYFIQVTAKLQVSSRKRKRKKEKERKVIQVTLLKQLQLGNQSPSSLSSQRPQLRDWFSPRIKDAEQPLHTKCVCYKGALTR